MQLLLKDNFIVGEAYSIATGVFDEPDVEKYALYDKDGALMYYAIKEHYQVSGEVNLPDDYAQGKYYFENGEFVLNEDWSPYVSPEDRIAELEKKVAELNGDAIWDEMAIAIEEGVNEV